MRHLSPAWLVVFAGVWWFLAAPRGDAWVVGSLAVLLGMLLHGGLGGAAPPRPRAYGIVVFMPFFLNRMVRGGLDVSRRALSPSLPLDPDLVHYRMTLPDGPARIFFINSISLMPGTFSARLEGDQVAVHRLDPEIAPEAVLRGLEAKVAGVFGVEPEERSER